MKSVRNLWDWIVAYLVPGPIYRTWSRFVWRPLRYRSNPWGRDACDYCPECQKLEMERDTERETDL